MDGSDGKKEEGVDERTPSLSGAPTPPLSPQMNGSYSPVPSQGKWGNPPNPNYSPVSILMKPSGTSPTRKLCTPMGSPVSQRRPLSSAGEYVGDLARTPIGTPQQELKETSDIEGFTTEKYLFLQPHFGGHGQQFILHPLGQSAGQSPKLKKREESK